jgi:hypothetical protein
VRGGFKQRISGEAQDLRENGWSHGHKPAEASGGRGSAIVLPRHRARHRHYFISRHPYYCVGTHGFKVTLISNSYPRFWIPALQKTASCKTARLTQHQS